MIQSTDSSSHRDLIRFLDDLGNEYDSWEGGLQRQLAERLVALVAPAEHDSCLDIGSGSGSVIPMLRSQAGDLGSVVSVDVAMPALNRAARDVAGSRTPVLNVAHEEFPFRDSTFDVVTLSRSIAYMPKLPAILSEARRVTRPGGRLALFCRRRTLATPAERLFLQFLAQAAERAPVRIPEEFIDYPGIADRDGIASTLEEAGFASVSFSDLVKGGRARDAGQWIDVMVRCWPAAAILLKPLSGDRRKLFEQELTFRMHGLGDDSYRYHHPYMFAVGTAV